MKNEDIWREVNIETMAAFIRQKRLRWYSHVLRKEGRKEGREEGRKEGRKEGREEGRKEGRKEGRVGCHQESTDYAGAGTEKNKRWLDNIREDIE